MPAVSSHPSHVIQEQVERFLGKNPSFRQLPGAQRQSIVADTAKVVQAMAAGRVHAPSDPYALGLDAPPASHAAAGQVVGDAGKLLKGAGAEKVGDTIAAGVTQAARMVKEIDFPAFVASLIEGTFHAIVKSSIEQMKAYADMVKSVSTSLNDFKDKNTTDNQAMDHLASRYPSLMQVTVENNQPKLSPRPGADTSELPDFQKDFGLSEPVTDLDDETIQAKLIPAARDDLARSRQQLLATIILMGINRIIVTDGRINAKIRFQFSANEKRQTKAAAFDYAYMGEKTTAQGQYESQYSGPQYSSGQGGGGGSYTGENRYATGQYQSTTEPDVKVTSEVDMSSDAAIQATGQITGEVSVNFKSETFPLEKMVDTDQMLKLQQAQGAGRGAPPAGAPGATPSAAVVAATAPAAAPAPSTAKA